MRTTLAIAVVLCAASCQAYTITATGITNEILPDGTILSDSGNFTFSTTFTDPLWDGQSALNIVYNGPMDNFSVGNGTIDSFSLTGLGFFNGNGPRYLSISFDATGTLFDLNAGIGTDNGFSWAQTNQFRIVVRLNGAKVKPPHLRPAT